ncbi:hypothetical protein [Streptomyces sp. S.PNR 29]|uniref:hypothetical protein n=1 Tax=Streptomyces sp. S.PNR 29 TaxID=2973805 RepID=UPI0025B2209D|nr:hypothetical protein [Streptomyces sp. S.PNR 29]MDN0198034.1 hypothetical protein [Streptomyces sp. S.PNR 29]
MPRGRHRHSPPLHRLLPPSAIAGVSLVCALGPWVFSEPTVLRSLAAAAAATAVVGAVVMRRWDTQAGKRVADLTRARASDEWRYEERVAELEADLEESRELRVKLEHRLRAKRTELAGLRNEHAALLRRYATAETERASALEGRRLLEIEAAVPTRALEAGSAQEPEKQAEGEAGAETAGEPKVPAVFSPEGAQLFVRAGAALARFDGGGDGDGGGGAKGEGASEPDGVAAGAESISRTEGPSPAEGASRAEGPSPADGASRGEGPSPADGAPKVDGASKADVASKAEGAARTEAASRGASEGDGSSQGSAAREDEAQGQPEAVDGHQHAAAATTPAEPAPPVQQPSGHFTVPPAVAVVPAAPARRATAEGGFDFFGTKEENEENDATSRAALEAVQNEDLADVVGQEALALHKAETEAQYKPADEGALRAGQVIDLTAHDETEQIDVQRLRSAAS